MTDFAEYLADEHNAGLDGDYAECPTRTPEPHLLGEFPLTCYRCHMEADA